MKKRISYYIPIYIFELIIGIILKQIFNDAIYQVKYGSIINIIYNIAIMFIMFLSGYECNIFQKNYKNIKYKKDTLLLLFLFYIISFCLSFVFIKKFNNQILGIILMTITFSATFANVIAQLIKDLQFKNNNINYFIIYFISISELLSIILISMLLLIIDFSVYKILSYFFLIIIFMLISLGIKKKYLFKNNFMLLIIIISLLIICSLITNIDDGELILGSFVLGMFLKYYSFEEENIVLIEKINTKIFMPIFFIIVGMKINIANYIYESERMIDVLLMVLIFVISKAPLIFIKKKYLKNTFCLLLLFACTLITSLSVSHLGVKYNAFDELFAEDIIFASTIICIICGISYNIIMKRKNKREK